MALHLFHLAAQHTPEAGRGLHTTIGAGGPALRRYLVDEVLLDFSPEEIGLLGQIAAFDQLRTVEIEQLLGPRAPVLLERVERLGLVATPAERESSSTVSSVTICSTSSCRTTGLTH